MLFNFRFRKQQRKGANITAKEKGGFVFYPTFYEAYKALAERGQGGEYIANMLRFAFDDLPPIEIEGDAIFNAFCAAFVPLITASKQDRENGQKGGRPKKENPG